MTPSDKSYCDRAPAGWRCYLPAGHEGPCPAWPTRLTRLKAWLRRDHFISGMKREVR